MKYPVAEKFFAPQGEGLYTGTPMAFIRLAGCSVGHKVCTFCDTDFDRMLPNLGGGLFTKGELMAWVGGYLHICLTGGEPLDRDIRELLDSFIPPQIVHLETSGTVWPDWLDRTAHLSRVGTSAFYRMDPGLKNHSIEYRKDGGWYDRPLWIAISPKPGYIEEMVLKVADEVKVVLGGLSNGPGWPTVEDAVRWADTGKLVYIQPRNEVKSIGYQFLDEALETIHLHPQLRLSVQMHKFLGVR
jgi:organic radical activating enzyme